MKVHDVLPICASVIACIGHGSAQELLLEDVKGQVGGLRRPNENGIVLLNQSPAVIKKCNDTSAARIRFDDGEGVLPTIGRCSAIVENGWGILACPQENTATGADDGEMIYETCGNECQFLSGCGLVITPSPTNSPTSASPSNAPTISTMPSASPSAIKQCENSRFSRIRFNNGTTVLPTTRGQCLDITVNGWESLACPQENAATYTTEMIYETCGNECQFLSGCGLRITDSPSGSPSASPSTYPTTSPTASPSSSPSASPSVSSRPSESPTSIKECENNSQTFVRFRDADNSPTFVRCEAIPENGWDSLACNQRNQRIFPIIGPNQFVFEICGYECSALSKCGLPFTA